MNKQICPQCKNVMKKNGIRNAKQRYRCVSCGYNFTSDKTQTLKQRAFNSNLKNFMSACLNKKEIDKLMRTTKIENIKVEQVDNLAPLLELKKNALVMFQCGNTIKYISLLDFMEYIKDEKTTNFTSNHQIEKLVNHDNRKKKHLSIDDFEDINIIDAINLCDQTEIDFE